MPDMHPHWITVVLLCLISSMSYMLVSHATDDEDHLRRIEIDVKRLATTLKTTNADSKQTDRSLSAKLGSAIDGERLPLGLQQDMFEQILRNEFLGTYTFYRKLSSKDKKWVFELYQQDNRISTIRQHTVELLSNTDP